MTSKSISRKKLYIFDILIFVLGVFLDRFSKYYALGHLKNHPSISLISKVLELRYLENTGAAFGLLKNQKSFFLLVGAVIVLACLYVLIKTPGKKKYIWCHVLVSLIITGAVGNMIDRILYGYVVDFIYISCINFPVFNVADVFITFSTFLFVLLLLFYYKEDDLNFLNFMEKKIRDVD